ncbi:MAG: branched-chain amino acid transaminase [Firmicutes bacterium]|jgi:branched-chain amino acid aminotransferase|nr:branched-chain amino acid transaminase [Bacillota bacterium]
MDNNRKMWLNGEIMAVKDAKINVLSPTSQFGANVFEGIRCYWNQDEKQLYAFRLDDHFDRLANSIKLLKLECDYTIEDMKKGFFDIIKANDYKEDIAVRQTVFLDGFGSWSSTGPTGMFIAPIARKRSYDKKSLKCCISSWERISDRSLSPRIKVGANYLNSRLAHMEALENGYDTAIIMNNAGKVAEAPGSCLFLIRDNELITPSITSSILESITRDTVIKLAKEELNMIVTERDVDRTELYIADEIFLCGSAMEIMSVSNVDNYEIGNEEVGQITKELQRLYFEVIRGDNLNYSKWITPVY